MGLKVDGGGMNVQQGVTFTELSGVNIHKCTAESTVMIYMGQLVTGATATWHFHHT